MSTEKEYELIPAVFTPMSADGNINLSILPSYAHFLINNGMSNVFINGSTGEGVSLTIEERKKIAEEWVRIAPPRMKIINHVGHNSLPEAKKLAKHAHQIRVHAISVMTPTFFKPASVDDLLDFLAKIAYEAPNIPFYFYYIPSLSHVYLNMLEFIEKATQRIPTFAGVKYTHEDLLEYRDCILKWSEKLNLLFGRDELLIHGLMAGANGSIGTTYNFIGPLYLKLIAAFRIGQIKEAQRLADKTTAFTKLIVKFGVLPAGKAYMKEIGFDCGSVRLPLKPMSRETYDQFLREISLLELDKI